MSISNGRVHAHQHAFGAFRPREWEGLTLLSRRNMLKAGLAGLAGLSVPGLLHQRARAAATGQAAPKAKSVLFLWMAGGPSHIDTWDPKPGRPVENRGPFSAISTRLPGVQICEHLPRMAVFPSAWTRSVSTNDERSCRTSIACARTWTPPA